MTTPKGKYGPESESGYADPGSQSDKKPRYPLERGGKLNEARIRAAWNYINKPKNAAKYSPGAARRIKSKIVAAWKQKIDKRGPPSVANMSEQQENFSMKKVKDFVIFRAGDYPQGEFTEQDLNDIVAGYDPTKLHEAPLTIGHMEDYKDSRIPAYGWIEGLKRVGMDLVATGSEMAEDAIQWIRDGYYKKLSATFYERTNPSNPTPGKYHLHHVALLGGQPPQVKGMPALGFCEFKELAGATAQFAEVEFAEATPEEIDAVTEGAEADTLASIEECMQSFVDDVKAIIADENVDDCEQAGQIRNCYWNMQSEMDGIISQHSTFMNKKDGMLDRLASAVQQLAEKFGAKFKGNEVKAQFTELFKKSQGITTTKQKESDMDAQKEKEFLDRIAAVEAAAAAQVLSFKEELKKVNEAKTALEASQKANADAIADDRKALANEKLQTRVSSFVEKKVAEGYSRKKLEEMKVPDMLMTLARNSSEVSFVDGSKKAIETVFEEFLSSIPKATFAEVVTEKDKPPTMKIPSSLVRSGHPIDGRGLLTVAFAEKYVNAHPDQYKGLDHQQAKRECLIAIGNGLIQVEEVS